MSVELYRRMQEHLNDPKVMAAIEKSLGEEALQHLAETCGIEWKGLPRAELLARLVARFREDEHVGHLVAQELLRANEEFVRALEHLTPSDIEYQLTHISAEVSHEGQERMMVALLADTRPEVNAMLEKFFGQGEKRETNEQMQEVLEHLHRELMEELEQVRRERAELIELLRELRTRLAETPSSSSSTFPAHHELPRMGLFVDVQNIFYNARNFYGRKLDFKKLMEVTTRGRQLVTAVAYLVLSPDVDQTNFITMLQQNGYAVREKFPRHPEPEEDVPVEEDDVLPMHLDILNRIEGLDVVVLVGSDGDVIGLTRRIQSSGAKVELYAFSQNISNDVVDAVDRFYPIDENLLLHQEYVPRHAFHNGPRGGGTLPNSANRLSRGFTGQRHRNWGTEFRGQ